MIWIGEFNKVEGVSGSTDFNISLRINGQSLSECKTSRRVGVGGEAAGLATDVTTSHNSVLGRGELAVLTLARQMLD